MANLITPIAILSYPWIFKPQPPLPGSPAGTEPKYGATFVFPKGTDLTALNNAAKEAAREKWGDKGEEIFRKQRHPLFKTDEDKGYPEGSIFLRASAKTAPGVVGRYKDPATGKPIPITDPAELYAGCMVRASLRAFAYDAAGNKGVSFGLSNIQKVGEGQRLDGRKKAEDEFDGEEAPAADDLL